MSICMPPDRLPPDPMQANTESTKRVLRRLAEARRGVLVPGAFNALSARVIEDLGFGAIYVTGAGVTNMHFGLPDQAFMGLHEIAEHTARIRDAVSLPLLVDADTGFGNALNVRHAVRVLERAGADCIQLEDQVSPKRCGHFAGKAVIDTAEMLGKIKAASDARTDADMLIMARTDAAAVHGFEAAVERAQLFSEAGADILFVEAVTQSDEVRALPRRLAKPQLMNMVIGGKTPTFGAEELGALGYGLVLYANAALQGAVAGMQRALTVLRDTRRLDEDPALVASFAERQRLVGKPELDELEKKYAG
jgi:2-methylisocitrate lyase-like PEP mutase family enzyme